MEPTGFDLAARIDVLMLAVITQLRLSRDPEFDAAFAANAQTWRDIMLMTRVPDRHLDEFDGALRHFRDQLAGPGG